MGQEYSQKTPYISITKTNMLILFKERIGACCGYHAQHMNILCREKAECLDFKGNGVCTTPLKHQIPGNPI